MIYIYIFNKLHNYLKKIRKKKLLNRNILCIYPRFLAFKALKEGKYWLIFKLAKLNKINSLISYFILENSLD